MIMQSVGQRVVTDTAAKATAPGPEEGFTLGCSLVPLGLHYQTDGHTHMCLKENVEKSQMWRVIPDYQLKFLQKYCTKIWINRDRERLTSIAASKPISTLATYLSQKITRSERPFPLNRTMAGKCSKVV